MIDGNTTVDTLIRIANGLDITLDDLVFGEMQTEQIDKVKKLLTEMQWYMQLAEEKRERLRYHLQEIVRLKMCIRDRLKRSYKAVIFLASVAVLMLCTSLSAVLFSLSLTD